MKTNYMIVIQNLANNSIFSLHVGIWLYWEGRIMCKFGQNGKSCARVTEVRFYGFKVRNHVIVHLYR